MTFTFPSATTEALVQGVPYTSRAQLQLKWGLLEIRRIEGESLMFRTSLSSIVEVNRLEGTSILSLISSRTNYNNLKLGFDNVGHAEQWRDLLNLSSNWQAFKDYYHAHRELIGKGTYGSVFQANPMREGQVLHNEIVAVKMIPIRREIEERLQRELRIVAEVTGDHLLGAIDILVEDDAAYVVMPKMQGTLHDEVVLRPGFNERLVRKAFRQLLLGMTELEGRRIAHREIKPANVLVSWRGNRRRPRNIQVRICDFGQARRLEADGAVTSTEFPYTPVMFTPKEVHEGTRHTLKSDCFAAGVLLYNLVCKQAPFAAGSEAEIRENICAGRVIWHQMWREGAVCRELRVLTERLLDSNPETRFNVSDALAHPWFQSQLRRVIRSIFDSFKRRLCNSDVAF